MAKQRPRKTFLGMPMNWDCKHPFRNIWNVESDEIFPPKSFGIGWTVNLHAVIRKLGLVPEGNKRKSSVSNKERGRV